MNKYILQILLLTTTFANADYLMSKDISSGITFKEPEPIIYPSSCLSILNSNSSSISGYYNLTIAGETIKTHCDMDSNGGGWTMVQVLHDEASTFTTSTDFETDHSNINNHASFSNAAWQEIKQSSTDIKMVKSDDYTKYMFVSIIKGESANCKPLGNTLQVFGKMHHEISGCDGSGTDYSLFGGNRAATASNLYGFANYYDSKTFSGYIVSNKSYIYVK